MQNDYIEIEGKDYRIEFNWNTISKFLTMSGRQLTDAEKISSLPAEDITLFIHCAMVEGCRLDGGKFPFTVDEVGGMMDIADIPVLFAIFSDQMSSKKVNIKAKKK